MKTFIQVSVLLLGNQLIHCYKLIVQELDGEHTYHKLIEKLEDIGRTLNKSYTSTSGVLRDKLIWISATHLPGRENVHADRL